MKGFGGGRPRTPDALKKLKGTLQPCRVNKRAPKVDAKNLPPPPPYFSEGEKVAWRYLAKLIDPLRVAAPADVVAFEQLVISYAIVAEARAQLRESDRLTVVEETNAGSTEKARPELAVLLNFKKQLSVELARFGLTPADRTKVSASAETPTADPLDEFTRPPGRVH